MASIVSGISLPTELLLSFALGTGARPAIEPFVQSLANEAWTLNAAVPPDAVLLAQGVAQGQVTKAAAYAWAKEQGFDAAQMDALVQIANTGPPLGMAMEAWRRGLLTQADFETALKRQAIEDRWVAALGGLKAAKLTPEQVAVLVQRSVIPNQGELPFDTTIPRGNVPPMPQVAIDGYAHAAAHGYSSDEVDALTRIIGLPASPDLAARMAYRGIITRDDFTRAIAEGNTRQEWAPFLFDGFREIPTAEQFVEAHLRGWIDQPAMYAGTALHGMSQADTDLEFRIHRRPMTMRQITQALAWGGQFNPDAGEIQDPYVASAHQQNLGPEWYDLAESLKHTYSVPFWWRSMVQAGALGATEAETILLRLGNPPDFATRTVAHFAGGTGATADPHVAKAQTQLWTTLHRSYVSDETDDALATETLGTAGVAAAAIPAVLTIWQAERALVRKQLTPAQLKKAYKAGDVNPATGAVWTLDEALARLVGMGYSRNDALTFLEE